MVLEAAFANATKPRFRLPGKSPGNPDENSVDASRLVDRVAALVEAARKAGADAADAVAVRGRSSSVSVRLGKVEATESSESDDISLRVFVGKRVASVSATAASDTDDACRARRRDGARLARGSLPGPRRPGPARQDRSGISTCSTIPRFAAERLKEDALAAEEAALVGEGRHQFRRQRRQRRSRRAGAGHLARLRRPVCRLALLALGQRHCRRGHGDGARLRLFLAAAFRRSRHA